MIGYGSGQKPSDFGAVADYRVDAGILFSIFCAMFNDILALAEIYDLLSAILVYSAVDFYFDTQLSSKNEGQGSCTCILQVKLFCDSN